MGCLVSVIILRFNNLWHYINKNRSFLVNIENSGEKVTNALKAMLQLAEVLQFNYYSLNMINRV